MKISYSFSETFKNAYSLLMTKLLYRPARLIRRPVYIRGRKGMQFGQGFTTGYRCRIELFEAQKGVKLSIGKNCKLGDNVHITSLEKITIGDDCLFASNIFISDNSHGDQNEPPTVPPDKRNITSNPVQIGNNVWIGEGVAVLPGAKIGNGCIIGAHSVVKGEIPDYSIAVGAPARVVKKYNFDNKAWERI